MRIEVKVPQLPESVTEATLVSWRKKAGEPVKRDENLIDVETDKVVLELPAPGDGVLVEITRPDGSTVTSNDVIGVIDTDAKGAQAATPDAKPAEAPSDAPPAMPAARKMMAEKGIAAQPVTGTGRDGRITKADVAAVVGSRPATDAHAKTGAKPAARPPAPVQAPAPAARPSAPPAPAVAPGARPEQRVPMSRLRQRVAERLVQSQSAAAILTTFNEVNMQPVIELRNRYKERFEKEYGIKLGFMGFVVKAAVHALRKFPAVNASIDGNDIVYHGYFDIGIAVGSPRGLVVPIVRDADQKSVAEIEKEIADFGNRASEGKLTIDELTGGTYTISNGGVFGSMLSTPILNPPQSAILGVHATRDRPVVENGQIVIRPINYLAQSYDHRIIDGREAVLSLVAIKEALEDPARMLLDL
jgi:2-oxoglutarate dehydrogenase E2 component (dihydrolipoamide succinyltransferase)